ncbi:hypothetical protein QCA50_005871 [Cerrena zonata]|uniref:Uncharacterized protein n=1 Tax=Cerrena zonata TaxID=2478898 RepID=A0AAW0GE83_9APHY
MPVPTRVQPEKNIWIAAGDGDLDRVRELIEQQCMRSIRFTQEGHHSPSGNDITRHAAASYGHIHVLEYLVSKGGNVNVTDNDDDTPLYVVENIETARWLVEHGAIVQRINHEGLSPASALTEDFPEVASYLESLETTPSNASNPTSQNTTSLLNASQLPSQHAQNQASEELTSELMERVQHIMERAEAEGRDPEEELRQGSWEDGVGGDAYWVWIEYDE